MCWMAAIPIAMQGASMVMGGMQQNSSAAGSVDQIRQQKLEMLRQANFTDVNLKMEDRQNLQDTIGEMSDNNMQSLRTMSVVRQAIGESGLSGNSMDRIANLTDADLLRKNVGLDENYQRDYAQILGKRISNAENTNAQLAQMKEPEVKSGLEQIVDPLGLGLGSLGFLATGGLDGKSGLLGSIFGKSDTPAAKITAAIGTKTGK